MRKRTNDRQQGFAWDLPLLQPAGPKVTDPPVVELVEPETEPPAETRPIYQARIGGELQDVQDNGDGSAHYFDPVVRCPDCGAILNDEGTINESKTAVGCAVCLEAWPIEKSK